MTDVTLYNFVEVDGKEWGIHLWGELEEYEDGSRQVVDIDARYIFPNGYEVLATDGVVNVPEEVQSLAQALLDGQDTSDDMLKHGTIHR